MIWCQERRRRGVASWRRGEGEDGDEGNDEDNERDDGDDGEDGDERKDEDSGEGLGGMSFRGPCVPGELFSAAVREGREGVERDSSSAAADSE
jgi:hypothetical protein